MPKIVLVDDEPTVVDVLTGMISALGHEVFSYTSPDSALLRIETGPVDLVIADLIMPGINGLELLRRVRRIDPELPYILLTGNADLESAIEALRLEADDFLQKPIDLFHLEFRINQSLARKNTREQIKLYQDLLPVCSGCRKIRLIEEEGQAAWVSLESYIRRRTGRAVSHGFCPECCQHFIGDDCEAN